MPMDVGQIKAYAADLRKVSAKVHKGASIVVRKTATDIESTAKQLAPVDTGALRGSIGADIQDLTATIGPTVGYAQFQEHGTSRMPPHPFMFPALDAHEAAFYAALDKVVEGALP